MEQQEEWNEGCLVFLRKLASRSNAYTQGNRWRDRQINRAWLQVKILDCWLTSALTGPSRDLNLTSSGNNSAHHMVITEWCTSNKCAHKILFLSYSVVSPRALCSCVSVEGQTPCSHTWTGSGSKTIRCGDVPSANWSVKWTTLSCRQTGPKIINK